MCRDGTNSGDAEVSIENLITEGEREGERDCAWISEISSDCVSF